MGHGAGCLLALWAPATSQPEGPALNDLSRGTGGAVGIAVLASVLKASYQSHLNAAHLPAGQVGLARSSVAVATRLGGPVAAHARTAFADGLQLALLIAAGTVALLMRRAMPETH